MKNAALAVLSIGMLAAVGTWVWRRWRRRGRLAQRDSEEVQLLMEAFCGISRAQARQAPLPALEVSFREIRREHSIVFPNPWCLAEGRLPDMDAVVCSVQFGVSPLGDRAIVDQLEVDRQHRRRGYAATLLHAVARHTGNDAAPLPLTAVHEVWDSAPFWNALRAGYCPGLALTMGISVSDAVAAHEHGWPPIGEETRSQRH